MFDGNFRTAFERRMAPVGRFLQKIGLSPDVITCVGVVMAGACAVAIANGRFLSAAVLLALTGLPDALDGAVAKASGRAGPRGSFFDSVADRLSDGLLFAGAGWYLLGTDTPRLAMLPFALYIAASLVSYQRAKAESLGFNAKGGLMERAERFIALGFGLVVSPLFVATLWVMLVLTAATAIFRFVKVWRQASAAPASSAGVTPSPALRTPRRRTRPVADMRRRAKSERETRRRSRG